MSATDHPGDVHEPDPLGAAADYLGAVRRDGDVAGAERRLAALEPNALAAALDADPARLAFWINVYNAGVQARLRERTGGLGGWRSRWRFFRRPMVTVAGTELSPNDVEHGILRRSSLGSGLGYLPRPFPDAFETTHRVDELDPRVHFALNCGAASCPAITVYEADAVDEQLDRAAATYLDATTEYDPDADRAVVSRLFLWYRGDFGGGAGIRACLREHGAIPDDANPKLRYQGYDWSLDLGRFRDDPGGDDPDVDAGDPGAEA